MNKFSLSIITLALLSGCSMNPEYSQPQSPVDTVYPSAEAYPTQGTAEAAQLQEWRSFFKDPALIKLIEQSLSNNRDLRVAALNVESYQAQYRIQRAELFPEVNANGTGTRQRIPEGVNQSSDSSINSQY